MASMSIRGLDEKALARLRRRAQREGSSPTPTRLSNAVIRRLLRFCSTRPKLSSTSRFSVSYWPVLPPVHGKAKIEAS
jgi:hypothetical protein